MTRVGDLGVVVIGRNEAVHLGESLESARSVAARVVYADSASTDASVEIAAGQGVPVVRLVDAGRASAAGARNAGFEYVAEHWPDVRYVQFLDGDCSLSPAWTSRAIEVLDREADVAVVCGRLHERCRGSSVYSRLLDMEFDREPGYVAACGGIFMARASAFREVGGFDPTVPAGEEPEFCLRIRRLGHRIVRLPDDMARHDGGMATFRDWWRRAARSGRAYAQASDLHGRDPERSGVRESASIWGWAVGIPAGAVGLAWFVGAWGLAVLAAFPLQAARIAWRRRRPGESAGDRLLFAAACMVAKFAQLQGQVSYWVGRRRRRDPAAPGTRGAEVTSCSRSSPS